MEFANISTQDLINELLDRNDGLSLIDEKLLADELIERDGYLNVYGTETLTEILAGRNKVDSISCDYSYRDYCVSIESGDMLHGTGKVTILIVSEF